MKGRKCGENGVGWIDMWHDHRGRTNPCVLLGISNDTWVVIYSWYAMYPMHRLAMDTWLDTWWLTATCLMYWQPSCSISKGLWKKAISHSTALFVHLHVYLCLCKFLFYFSLFQWYLIFFVKSIYFRMIIRTIDKKTNTKKEKIWRSLGLM